MYLFVLSTSSMYSYHNSFKMHYTNAICAYCYNCNFLESVLRGLWTARIFLGTQTHSCLQIPLTQRAINFLWGGFFQNFVKSFCWKRTLTCVWANSETQNVCFCFVVSILNKRVCLTFPLLHLQAAVLVHANKTTSSLVLHH